MKTEALAVFTSDHPTVWWTAGVSLGPVRRLYLRRRPTPQPVAPGLASALPSIWSRWEIESDTRRTVATAEWDAKEVACLFWLDYRGVDHDVLLEAVKTLQAVAELLG